MRVVLVLLCSLASLVASAVPGTCADWTFGRDRNGATVVSLRGDIRDGDASAFAELAASAARAGAPVTLLRLDSPGGVVGEGLRIATTVLEAHVATVVDDGGTCASSCFLVLSAGHDRYAGATARVGVHGASQEREQTRCARGATISIAQYLKSVGVPYGVIGRMAATPPEEVAWLDRAELAGMGVHVLARSADLAVPPPGGAAAPRVAQAGTTTDGPNDAVWAAAMAHAVSASTQQGGGRLQTTRTCDPQGVCTASVLYLDPKGRPAALRLVADAQDRVVDRSLCVFAADRATRTCVDFATGRQVVEVLTPANGWVQAGAR